MSVPLKIMGIYHYTICVADLDASVKWHSKKLGYIFLPEKNRNRGSSVAAYMQAPGFLLEIIEVPGAAPVPAYALAPDTDMTVRGHKHYALAVNDLKEAANQLRTLGAVVVDEKEVGSLRAAFIADDSGMLVELIQLQPMPGTSENKNTDCTGQPIPIEGIHHVAINVPNRDETVAWYRKIFGFTPGSMMEFPGVNVKVGFLNGPGFNMEVFEVPYAMPIPDQRLDPDQDMETLGNKYFSFAVSDIDEATARLRILDVDILGEKRSDGGQCLFIRDEAGIVIGLKEI